MSESIKGLIFLVWWIRACVDEIEKVVREYKEKVGLVSEDEYLKIMDPQTENNDTKSIHNMTSPVVVAGLRMCALQSNAIRVEASRPPNVENTST